MRKTDSYSEFCVADISFMPYVTIFVISALPYLVILLEWIIVTAMGTSFCHFPRFVIGFDKMQKD